MMRNFLPQKGHSVKIDAKISASQGRSIKKDAKISAS